MTEKQKVIMRNIIYAVETGGNVYGNKDYAMLIEAGHNTALETAITIGAGQWHANEARKLLTLIQHTDNVKFSSLDTAAIAADLTNDWTNYRVSSNSEKAICIQTIINSSIGRGCQDQLLDEQMETFVNETSELGVLLVDAQMMCANFRHQGGLSAVKRILAKTSEPYTLDGLYESSKSDVGNQVGTYKQRQAMVYHALKEYISTNQGEVPNQNQEELTPELAIQRVIELAEAEVGYLEKASNNNLDSKTDNAGVNNYTKYWRDIKPDWQKSAWCAVFVTWILYQAFGEEIAQKILKKTEPWTYVSDLKNYPNHDFPEVGDFVLFWRPKQGRHGHTGIVVETNKEKGTFYAVEGNTSASAGVEDNGEGVYRKGYTVSEHDKILFIAPDYTLVSYLNEEDIFPEIKDEDQAWKTIGTAYCSGNSVYVRKTPGGTILGSLSKGASFEVDGNREGVWIRVKASSTGIGYMHESYVSYSTVSTGSTIEKAQKELNNLFNAGLVVDGKWGHASNTAYVKAIQKAYNLVYNENLSTDGIWGSKTATACGANLLKKGDINLCVGVLQIGLYAHNYSLVGGLDHSFGLSTEQAVKQYQKETNLSSDGICGKDVFAKLVGAEVTAGSELFPWKKSGLASCSGNGVYVRQAPEGKPLGQLSRGNKFEIDGTRIGSWIHIKTDQFGIGYMHESYISYGSFEGSSVIKTAQTTLNTLFNSGLTADGFWGAGSKKAYIKAIQIALNKVYGTGLSTDGIWGSKTAAACGANALKKGTSNLFVSTLQIGLYAHNISLSNGIDHVFGTATERAVMAYQDDEGLTADGIAGANTFISLIQ